MKKIVLCLIISLLVFSSCEYEKDLFQMNNENPSISFVYKNIGVEDISDSIKISLKNLGNTQIPFDILINDKSENLKISSLAESGQVLVDDEILSGTLNLKNGKYNLKYIPEYLGINEVEISVIDTYNQVQTKNVQFYVFNNMAPVANLTVDIIGQNSPYEVRINAGNSYDQDYRWGGKVEKYIYKVGSYYEYETADFNSIKHILPGPGTYVVSLVVIDNDGESSLPVFTEVNF